MRFSASDAPVLRHRWLLLASAALAIGLIGAGLSLETASAAQASAPLQSLSAGKLPPQPGFHARRETGGESDANVCSTAVPAGEAHCDLDIRIDSRARSQRPAHRARQSSVLGNNGAYDPSYLQSAYNVASAVAADGGGAGEIVAIVDAYDDPNVASDVSYYRSFFGLPGCPAGTVSPAATGCVFEKVSQTGSTTAYPTSNSSWAAEAALDVEMVSAVCAKCQILLVEANSDSLADLGAAVNEAVYLGAAVVSNSYGGNEYSSEHADSLNYYDHPGVAVVASAGDDGYGVEFPAASPYVTAVGGTSLTQLDSSGTRDGSETAWSGGGGGCSAYESKPSWQSDTGCPRRAVADVSAVADPNTGVWMYDTYGNSGWAIYGGTSVAAPVIASFYALGGNLPSSTGTPVSNAYANSSALYDVTSGSDGSCSPAYLCTAGAGYDGPTGLGTPGQSPDSLAAFLATAATTAATAPGAPLSLKARTSSTGGVLLSWSVPRSNGGAAITSYALYRGTSSGREASYLSVSCTASTCTYTDSGMARQRTYYYEVAAVNAVGQGPLSNQAAAIAR